MLQTIIDLPVLSTLRCGEMGGYALARNLGTMPHVVYATLHRLRQAGLVLQHQPSRSDKKSFRLSKRGKRLLGEELLWQRLVVGKMQLG